MVKYAIFPLLLLCCFGTSAFGNGFPPLSARQAFSLIPTEIFDTTEHPLDEEDKEKLAEYGTAAFWTISQDKQDLLAFRSDDDKAEVSLRMFRTKNGSVAAFRSKNKEGECLSELWYIHDNGHTAPLPLPPEPDTQDFFLPDTELPDRLSSSCAYCVFEKGLEVLPSFTSNGIPCDISADNAVFYLWDGHSFSLKIKTLDGK